MSPVVSGFLAGLITMCFAASGLCFVRFWWLRRDPLLGAFAVAFWLLAAHQAIVGLLLVPREERSLVYLLRVAAFAVIAVAILRKNMSRRAGAGPSHARARQPPVPASPPHLPGSLPPPSRRS